MSHLINPHPALINHGLTLRDFMVHWYRGRRQFWVVDVGNLTEMTLEDIKVKDLGSKRSDWQLYATYQRWSKNLNMYMEASFFFEDRGIMEDVQKRYNAHRTFADYHDAKVYCELVNAIDMIDKSQKIPPEVRQAAQLLASHGIEV